MSTSFQCTAFGKWILMGDHSVIRGYPSLVFPIPSRTLELKYTPGEHALVLDLKGDHGQEMQLLFWGVLERAFQLKNIPRPVFTGTLHVDSSLPVGAGMGASAALCVALTRWLGHLGYVQESEYFEFARSLEDLFHGESSGIDISVALSGQGLRFVRNGERTEITPKWKPRWYISYSGKRGVTADAVNKVKDLLAKQPPVGQQIDLNMAKAVETAQKALLMDSESEGLQTLVQALNMGAECFDKWGLNEGAPASHIAWLREQGAIAVKPTGSGGGGYVISLWEKPPSAETLKNLIPC
ncbi:mevalonate kinase family protein [Bdellovibrio sp. GT3]|uniref:mevalonate kinase family protein n=1 Tax=Bdellovibrio sp. GT3 TaxID=3136282 RepID=UPI0030EFF3FF